MASKFLFFPLLMALALHLSAGQLGALPLIDIINTTDDKISVGIKARGIQKGSIELEPNKNYQIKVDVNDVYFVSATYGLKFASFHAYEPKRDEGRAAIYWKADKEGFSISYDNKKFKKDAPWESE